MMLKIWNVLYFDYFYFLYSFLLYWYLAHILNKCTFELRIYSVFFFFFGIIYMTCIKLDHILSHSKTKYILSFSQRNHFWKAAILCQCNKLPSRGVPRTFSNPCDADADQSEPRTPHIHPAPAPHVALTHFLLDCGYHQITRDHCLSR